MKTFITTIGVTLTLLTMSGQALAQGSIQHSAQAFNHSVQASGHTVIAGAKLSAGVIAVPLLIAGSVGAVSAASGNALMHEADNDFGKPLQVSDEAITAGPTPTQAIYGPQRQE
ncbi:mechanosensitive ion channel protein MscS [Mariprofundus erugo]|uniref:Mechanosensitive ion channel protein MscS n=1 Tax=Mariprofundus erugo TaxID=2528639 RepID=A0A5R9GUS6_9PROT|nr:mechanosensitive ion channel protein MscS [Mariprofundus erugo]TLS68599.1 mechanosensitive ion channel protein MscS [Mariprofundus erugo]TLS76958.1 mechanosensitive ion channel protein MscS [Mariprofundus erugo]